MFKAIREFGKNMVQGVTRIVFLTKKHAIKMPNFFNWRLFLQGLLANLYETSWWNCTHDPRLCPIVFGCPGGWFVIMKRADILNDDEHVPYDDFLNLPLDPKPSNFGRINGKLVMVDYGS